MLGRWFQTLVCLALVTNATLVCSEELPLCDVRINADEVVRAEDIPKLHNCHTRRFPVTAENGFTNDLGYYSGTWKHGKRDGKGAMTTWLSLGMTSSWKNDRPSDGLAYFSSCTSQTYGYVYNSSFYSFTLPLDWLARVTWDWDVSWLSYIFSALASGIQALLSVILR